MPRTVQVLLVGLALLLIMALIARLLGGPSWMTKAIQWFFPVWLGLTAYNMYEGVRVGHGIVEEIPFLLINFGVPAVIALFVLKKIGINRE